MDFFSDRFHFLWLFSLLDNFHFVFQILKAKSFPFISTRINIFFLSRCLADTSEFVGTTLLYVFNILSFSTKVSVLRTWACFSVCEICRHKVIWSHPSKRWKRTRNTTVSIQKLLVEVAKIIDKYTIFPGRAAETSSRKWKSKTLQCRTDWNPFSGLIGLITFHLL